MNEELKQQQTANRPRETRTTDTTVPVNNQGQRRQRDTGDAHEEDNKFREFGERKARQNSKIKQETRHNGIEKENT